MFIKFDLYPITTNTQLHFETMTSIFNLALLFDDTRLNRLNREQLLTAIKFLRTHIPAPVAVVPPSKPFDADRYAVRRVALRVAYQGWDFRGVAAQGDTDETIEGELFKALVRVRMIESVKTCNFSRSGRTDKGVSAFEQVFALDVRSQCAPTDGAIGFVRAALSSAAAAPKPTEMDYALVLNRVLPPSIRVTAWAPVSIGFDARFSTLYRTYRYYFFDRHRLDLRRMREAARHFVGEHDFRNFCKVDFGVQSFMRTIIAFEVRALETTARAAHRGRLCELRVRGFAFLWHQVRNMAAVLFAVGEGLEEPSVVQRLLDVDAVPAKPVYEMASDMPLVLHEAVYEGVAWNNDAAPYVAASLAAQAEETAMRLAVLDGFIESLPANAGARLLADAESTRSKHQPLLSRRCEPPVAQKQAKLAAKRDVPPRADSAADDNDDGHANKRSRRSASTAAASTSVTDNNDDDR
jgi:tRNA pseudouridine38/39 synthase